MLLAALAATACGGGQLSSDAEQARSLRAAAHLIAVQASGGQLTAPYVHAQSEEMARSAASLAQQLRADAGDPAARDSAAREVQAVEGGMSRLAAHPDDRALAAEVARSLEAPTR